jgi:hypothetical protein
MQLRSIFIGSFLIFLSACSAGVKTAPVSGIVTLDGKPLANAHVAFQPTATTGKSAGMGSAGVTDQNGAYMLRLSDSDQPGAVIGNHRVEINLKQEADDRDPKLRPPSKALPPQYNRQSTLEFNVESGGSAAANFDLKSR